jgi:hypothetical protein
VEQISKRLMNWASILEPETRAQAERTAAMPFIYPHLALMPDAHLGKGATVGSVIPTLGAIIPAAVGVDIGCGMVASRLSLTPTRSAPAATWARCASTSSRSFRCQLGSTTRPSTMAAPTRALTSAAAVSAPLWAAT